MSHSLYEIGVEKPDGTPTNLSAFKGKVLLIVNVASRCGLTPQYEGLQKLQEKYEGKGFSVLGFPANDFLWQEPGSNEQICEFAQSRYNASFPLFAKISVKGKKQHPLYRHLTEARPNLDAKPALLSFAMKYLPGRKTNDVHWNFEKFLVNRSGEIVARFPPDLTPDARLIQDAIEAALNSP